MRINICTRLRAADVREFGISVLLAAVVLFLAAVAILSRNVGLVNDGFAKVEHAYKIQKQIDTVNARLTGIEMTVRGYALTGDAAFQRRHRETNEYLILAMSELDQLIADEPSMQPDYAALNAAVAEHERLYDKLIANGPDHQAIVAEAISNPQKRQILGRAIDALTRLENHLNNLLGQRRAAADQEIRATYKLAIAVAGIAFLTGTLGFALLLFGRCQNR